MQEVPLVALLAAAASAVACVFWLAFLSGPRGWSPLAALFGRRVRFYEVTLRRHGKPNLVFTSFDEAFEVWRPEKEREAWLSARPVLVARDSEGMEAQLSLSQYKKVQLVKFSDRGRLERLKKLDERENDNRMN